MAGLTPADLSKSGREYRIDVILDKIKNKKPFDIVDGTSMKLQFLDKATERIFKKRDFEFMQEQTKSGKPLFKLGTTEIKLNQILKNADFGGGGKGAGGGTKDTTINESLQCFYTSLLFNTTRKKLTKDNCSLADLISQLKYCFAQEASRKFNTKKAITELYNSAPEEWIEIDKKGEGTNVYMRIANALYNAPVAKKMIGQAIYFHRGSPFMDAIYHARKRAWDFEKDPKNKNNRTAPLSGLSNNKWNPGDIWMSTLDPNPSNSHPFCFANEDKSTCKTFDLLKDEVIQSARDGKILAVSLKEVGATAKIYEFNTEARTQNTDVIYQGFTFGQTGDFFSSTDMYLYFNTGTMQLRSTASTKSWQGEIKGTLASGGKIGGGGLNYYCETFFGKSIGHDSVIGHKNWKEKTKVDKGNMFTLYKKYVGKQNKNKMSAKTKDKQRNLNLTPVKDKKTFEENADGYKNRLNKPAAPAFYFSKYMSLLLLDNMLSTPKSVVKEGWLGNNNLKNFSTKIVRYAMSNINIASFFIKVS